MCPAASEDSLAKVMESFFFKKWLPDPALSFDVAEKRDGIDLSDVFVVKDLPIQKLQRSAP